VSPSVKRDRNRDEAQVYDLERRDLLHAGLAALNLGLQATTKNDLVASLKVRLFGSVPRSAD
jgi:hypothetical protein